MESNRRTKKIAIILPELNVGGAEKLSISLVNNFIKNNVEAHFISIIYTTKSYELLDELHPDVKVKIFERRRKYDFSIGKQVLSYLKEQDIKDVMIVDLFVYFLIRLPLLFMKDKLGKINLFLSLHFTKPRSVKEFLLNFIYFRFVNKNTRVLYIFKLQREFFKKKYLLRSPHAKVIYNGVDSNYFSREHFDKATNSKLRCELNIGENDKIITIVGRISFEKGHSYAIQSLKILHDRYDKKDTHLLFIGAGSEEYVSSLKTLANNLGLNNFIHFIGNKKDVRPYYLISDLFTLTSITEAFSLAALEAMSFGLPCSLTNVGGASEMIIPGHTGLLSKSKDAVSIAESWNSILNSTYCANTIRNHVRSKFSSSQMFEDYYSTILQ